MARPTALSYNSGYHLGVHRATGDVSDFLVRGLMKKHEDHVRVLEALIYNQETLLNLKDAKIEELQDNKQQLQYHLNKLQDNQLFFDVRA